MSLENLPNVDFCNTDADTIRSSSMTIYEGIVDRTLFPGDPERLFVEGLVSVIIQLLAVINFTGKQNLLKYGAGDYLKHLGAFTNTEILGIQKARTTMRYSIDEALGVIVPIPIGSRVSPDSTLLFETVASAQVDIGNTQVDVIVECQTAGAIGNGFIAGQINKMVDPIDYVSSVSNIDTSSGGADEEEDDPYRERIHTAPESFSVAGPTGAYKHWAMSAHQDISDVAVYRTSPLDALTEANLEGVLDIAGITYAGKTRDEKQILVSTWLASAVVHVSPLVANGVLPDQTMLDLVAEKLNDRSIRPLTDQVAVSAPTQESYNINMTYTISSRDRLLESDIQAAVAQAVSDYTAWQKEIIGRAINPDQLIHLVKAAGAHAAGVISPVYTTIGVSQVAQEGTISITYGGLVDEPGS